LCEYTYYKFTKITQNEIKGAKMKLKRNFFSLVIMYVLVMVLFVPQTSAGYYTNEVTVTWETGSNESDVSGYGKASDYWLMLKMFNTARELVKQVFLSEGQTYKFAAKSDYYYLDITLVSKTILNAFGCDKSKTLCQSSVVLYQKEAFGNDDFAGKYGVPRSSDDYGYFPIAAILSEGLSLGDLVEVTARYQLMVPYIYIYNNAEYIGGGGGGFKYLDPGW
jgi:hypothetical protein